MIRLVFLGTPAFSVPCLNALLAADDVDVLGVITQPDRPAGRGQKPVKPPVKVLAEEANLPVFQPTALRSDTPVLDWLTAQAPDFLVTIAFGQILSQAVLDIPQRGTVNVHASLLPQYRGANPIQRAILDGMTETGLTTMLTTIGVDTGPMLLTHRVPIGPDETAVALHDKLANAAGPLLLETLRGLVSGTLNLQPQDDTLATHAKKGSKADAPMVWSLPARVLHNQVRGQQPWPGSTTLFQGNVLKVLKSRLSEATIPDASVPGDIVGVSEDGVLVQTGDGLLELLMVQASGKRPVQAKDWAHSALKPMPSEGLTSFRFE